MNIKQQQLTFDKGITNVPSDALCSDNTLEDSLGMVYDDGEHRVIQHPKLFADASRLGRLVFIHKFDTTPRYIFYNVGDNGGYLKWYTHDGQQFVENIEVSGIGSVSFTDEALRNINHRITAIGKTLIVSGTDGMKYFVWKSDEGKYKDLGDNIPVPKLEAYLEAYDKANTDRRWVSHSLSNPGQGDSAELEDGDDYLYYEPADAVASSASHEGIFKTNHEGGPAEWDKTRQEDYNNLVVGLYAKNKRSVKQKKCFCNPFFIRVALELYDGSYTHISNPILLLPAIKHNSYARMQSGWSFTMYTFARELMFKQTEDYAEWADLVKDVVIFASDEIDIYDTTMDVPIYKDDFGFEYDGVCRYQEKTYYTNNCKYCKISPFVEPSVGPTPTSPGIWSVKSTDGTKIHYHFNPLPTRAFKSIDADIKATSIFRKICSIGRTAITSWAHSTEYIEDHVLENFDTQDLLEYDDYYSACPMSGEVVYAYNSRLNLANVSRGFFAGFHSFIGMSDNISQSTTYSSSVQILTETGYVKVDSSFSSVTRQLFYYYYPDPRAKYVTINDNTSMSLEEHAGLHGAFFFAGVDAVINNSSPSSVTPPQGTPDASFETLLDYILTSDVNNPWTFRASGYNKVGTGEILGISTITQALSQGQFGQYPLLVFSKEGIWAMAVDNTGLFANIHPMSREVCNNPASITQTDGAVFFTSKKGLMAVVGSQVECVSRQMAGREITFDGESVDTHFADYLENCFIAYDYRDSLLWIFLKNKEVCYVYSIKSKTFGRYQLGGSVAGVVNNYPDYLMQYNDGGIETLLERVDINEDTDVYSTLLITRPMKLENAMALKTILQARNVYQFTPNEDHPPKVTLRIYASNNLNSWIELHSLGGMPWKYYRFRYDFANIRATDRFSGTMLVTQERRTNKLR